MIGILKFQLPEDRVDFEGAQNWHKYKATLDDFYTEVLRPVIKYGLSGDIEDEIFAKIDTNSDPKDIVEIVFQVIADKYHEIRRENDVTGE